jgi:hypothetical protein
MAITPGGASQTPAGTTLTNLKTEIARYVKAPNSTEVLGVASDGVDDAIRFMNTRPWEFNLTSEEITTVAAQKEYDIDATVKLPRHCELLDSSDVAYIRLPYFPPKDFLTRFQARSGSGDPLAYTIFNPYNYGQLSLSVAPSATWVAKYPKIRHWFYRYIQFPASDADVIDVPNDVERVIVWKAKLYMAELFGSDRHISVARANFKEAFTELKKQHRRDDTDWAGHARSQSYR